MAIHIALLIVIFQIRTSVEPHLSPYTATALYLPTVESVLTTAPKVTHPLVLHTPQPRALNPPYLVAKLPPPAPALDLAAPPELLVTHKAPPPTARPLLPVPAPKIPASAPAVFASALPAAPSAPLPAISQAASFGSVPSAAAPATAKLQVAGVAFGTVPAGTPRSGSSSGPVLPAGFSAPAVAAVERRRGPSVALSNGFAGAVAAAPAPEPAAKPKTAATAFTSATAADPVWQPTAGRKPASEPLEILFKPRPGYTEEARKARIEGDVVVEVLFPATGNLRVLRIVHGLGHGLDQNAIDAAAKIRFRPATENARAIDTVAMVRISFQIAY